VTFPLSGARKPTLDEQSFQQLLAAAYALQENKDVLQAGSSDNDSASVFSEIAGLRSRILARVETPAARAASPKTAKPKTAAEAAALVADCVRRLTRADGASVCLIIDGYLRPTSCSGTIAKVSGGSVASNSLVATERLRNGRAFQSANACSDIRLGPSLCVDLHIGSLLTFPIERQNEIAGLIEVRWTKADAFSDGDERICQLMADLMGEVLGGEDGGVTPSMPAPSQHSISDVIQSALPTTNQAEGETPSLDVADGRACRVCGKPLIADNSFCGSCGMVAPAADDTLQGKWASMWFMQQAQKAVQTEERQGERLWPLHTKMQNGNAGGTPGTASPTESSSGDTETDEAGDTSKEPKRSPRGVLAVLKSRLRTRAMGQ
jgi:hypothetical protein